MSSSRSLPIQNNKNYLISLKVSSAFRLSITGTGGILNIRIFLKNENLIAIFRSQANVSVKKRTSLGFFYYHDLLF